jgi:integrase
MPLTIYIQGRPRGRWRLRAHDYPLKDVDRYLTGTRAEAEAAAAAWQIELEQHGPALCSPHKALGDWLREHLARQTHLADRTVDYYLFLIDRFIDPPADAPTAPRSAGQIDPKFRIGRRPLDRITPADGISFLRWLQDSHDGKHRTIYAAFHHARAGLAEAARMGIIPVNPWDKLRKQRGKQPVAKIPSRIETRRVAQLGHDAKGNDDPRLQLLLDLALATGARRGELLALRWRDLDLAESTMTITAALQQRGAAVTVKPPKTAAGARSIFLDGTVLAALHTARAAAAERSLADRLVLDDLPVLPADDGLSWWSPAAASQAARRALHRGGVAVSLHALRHAHATTLLSEKISPRAVQQRLGHSSVAVTLGVYAHAMPEDDRAAAAAMARALARIA